MTEEDGDYFRDYLDLDEYDMFSRKPITIHKAITKHFDNSSIVTQNNNTMKQSTVLSKRKQTTKSSFPLEISGFKK